MSEFWFIWALRNILSKLQWVQIFVKSRKVRNTAQSTKMVDVYFLADWKIQLSQFNLRVKFQLILEGHNSSSIQISWQIKGSEERAMLRVYHIWWLVWSVEIKRARRKIITVFWPIALLLEDWAENFDFATIFTNIIQHVSWYKLFFDIVDHTCKQ